MSTCARCGATGEVEQVGTASHRNHFRCPKCGAKWREKNQAAAELGRLGGLATASRLTAEQRTANAVRAGEANAERIRKNKRKLKQLSA